MAHIETLIRQISDPVLRDALSREVAELKKRTTFGLVFERHMPESTRLLVAPIKPGAVVRERRSAKPARFRVRRIEGDELVLVAEGENETAAADAPEVRMARANVLVEKPFTEPIFPGLESLGSIRNGPTDRPSHAVIRGENFHAIAALLPVYEGHVDLLYLDPPYDTGDSEWSYNNDYVDPTDAWRPSLWLAFMERRLRLGRRLLKPDGVMVVTMDEHHVIHLGMLLAQTFPEARIQMVTIVINPSGVDHGGLSRVEEYAFFCFFGSAQKPYGVGDDLLADEQKSRGLDSTVRWEQLLRAGASGVRGARGGAKMFYPVLVRDERVIGVGEPLLDRDPDPAALIDGARAIWPIRENGTWGQWRISGSALLALLENGLVKLGRDNPARGNRVIYYVSEKVRAQIAAGEIAVMGRDENNAVVLAYAKVPRVSVKTVWSRVRHNAGMSGSQLLLAFMGQAGFSFPKSLYAVRDAIAVLLRDKPDALVVDFFAGSGTTLHATMLLNSEDGGRRRCVLVTNNEVTRKAAARLNKDGHFVGDPEFEAAGVYESSTRPRTLAALTGRRPNGDPVVGEYLDGRPYSEGFEENVEFFGLTYLDPAAIELGLCVHDLHPLLWLAAGGVGERADLDPASHFAVPQGSTYAVLFDPAGMPGLLAALAERPKVTHVFIVAASERAFADMAEAIPNSVKTVQLWRSYLETLRGAAL